MAKRAVALLPLLSLAVQVTVVRPTRKRLPDFGLQTAGNVPSVASVALTE